MNLAGSTFTRKLPLPFFLLFLATALFLLHKIQSRPESKFEILIPPLAKIEYFHFGFPDLIADNYWLQYIQDMGACEMTHRVGVREVQPRCDRGWSFRMLDAITTLAPRFRMPYATGGIALSILNRDVEGARIIFERGLKNIPFDWPIAYRAAYHFHFDQNDLIRGAELYKRAASLGAPPWLNELSAKLHEKSGNKALALGILEEYKEGQTDPDLIKRLDERIAELKKAP